MERTYSFCIEPVLVCLAETLSGNTFLIDSVLRKINPTSPLMAASLVMTQSLPQAPQKAKDMLFGSTQGK